jgi:hypothetical protein
MDNGMEEGSPARDMDVAAASGRLSAMHDVAIIHDYDKSRSRPDASSEGANREPAQLQWRAAILAVHRAQLRYQELLNSPSAAERAVELAWLALYRAERRRDAVLQLLS